MKKVYVCCVALLVCAVGAVGAAFAQSNADLGEAAYSRGNTAFDQENYDLAIREYTEAIRLLPNAEGVYLNRGLSYFQKSDWDRAITDFNQTIRLNPNYAGAYYYRGRSFHEKRDYDRAITDYTQTIRLNANYANAYYWRGSAYITRSIFSHSPSDVNNAEADYNTLARLEPNSSRSTALRGLINGQKRESWYTAAAAPATGSTPPQTTPAANGNTTRSNAVALRLGQDLAVIFSGAESRWYSFDITQNNSALVVQTRGSVDTLLDLYDGNGNRIASDDDSGDSYNARISRTLNPGKYYVEVKNYDKKAGQSTLNAAVQSSAAAPSTGSQPQQTTPATAQAAFERGNAFSDQRNYDAAIREYTEAIRLNPNYAEAYFWRGNQYFYKSDYDRAIADYTEAIRINPNYGLAYYNRGNAYEWKGDMTRANADKAKARELGW